MEKGEQRLVATGIKLASGRVKHFSSASLLWRIASRLGNRRALRLLVRVAIDYLHCGLMRRRPLVLEILKNGSVLGLRYERLYELFDATLSTAYLRDSMTRLAESGDDIAGLVLAKMMQCARLDNNYEFIVQTYQFLTRALENGSVTAAKQLADQLRLDGHVNVALTLRLWAANRGNFAAIYDLCLLDCADELSFCVSPADQLALVALAGRRAFDSGDPWAAVWLGSRMVMHNPLDFVTGARLLRLAQVEGLVSAERLAFHGEVLCPSDLKEEVHIFALMFEEVHRVDPCFNFTVKPIRKATH